MSKISPEEMKEMARQEFAENPMKWVKLKVGGLTIITLAEETEAWKILLQKIKENGATGLTENEIEMINSIGVF